MFASILATPPEVRPNTPSEIADGARQASVVPLFAPQTRQSSNINCSTVRRRYSGHFTHVSVRLKRETTDWRAKVPLTNNCQIDGEIPGGRCAEIHSAAVDPLVVQLDAVQGERRWLGHRHEVGPGPEHRGVRPVQGLVECPTSHVVTGTGRQYEILLQSNQMGIQFLE